MVNESASTNWSFVQVTMTAILSKKRKKTAPYLANQKPYIDGSTLAETILLVLGGSSRFILR